MELEQLLAEYDRLHRRGLISEEEYERQIARLRVQLIEQQQEERRLASILRVEPGTVGRVLTSQVFWVILTLAMMPLVMTALGLPRDDGLILYFAFLWFILFLRLFRLNLHGSQVLDFVLVSSLTVVPGIVIILPVLRYCLSPFYSLLDSQLLATRAMGYLLGVGPTEELTKVLAVLLVVLLARHGGRRPGLQAMILLGITAGLAFAGFENILYSDWFGTKLWGVPYTRQDVVLSRLLMTPFLHSLWAGLCGFALGVVGESGPLRPGRLVRIGAPALLLAAMLHGLYDTLAAVPILAVATAAVSYLTLVMAVAAAKQWERDTPGFLQERLL